MSSRRSARRYESRCWDRGMMSLASHTLYCLDLMFHFCWLPAANSRGSIEGQSAWPINMHQSSIFN